MFGRWNALKKQKGYFWEKGGRNNPNSHTLLFSGTKGTTPFVSHFLEVWAVAVNGRNMGMSHQAFFKDKTKRK